MIVPDVNLLIHAHNSGSRRHAVARTWWEDLLNGSDSVGIAWIAVLGFIRITTSARVLRNPLRPPDACQRVRSWLAQPQTLLVDPGDRHADILFQLLETLGAAGNLTTDAHLAALAIEHQAVLHSTDADMSRFPGLKWINPFS